MKILVNTIKKVDFLWRFVSFREGNIQVSPFSHRPFTTFFYHEGDLKTLVCGVNHTEYDKVIFRVGQSSGLGGFPPANVLNPLEIRVW